jgi:imidazolonepropionase-like amidohydrolase
MNVLRLAGVVIPIFFTQASNAQDSAANPGAVTLFQNVRVFDGKSEQLTGPMHVLVRGNKIEKISAQLIATDRRADTRLMDIGYITIVAGKAVSDMLMRGFTSARDMGGPVFGLKRAIDSGVIAGPRIWPVCAMISQTSGHGDYRSPNDLPRDGNTSLSFSEKIGATAVADGVPAVLQRVREQLMKGASQIKVMAGGGIASDYDPLDVTQYTFEEIKAAVDAAASWNTYVTVHAYTPAAMQQAIRAGVKCIEHGNMADEESARLMAEKGVWWCLQPFLDDEDANPQPEGSPNRLKQIIMMRGTDTAYALAKKHKVKTAFGTDTLFDATVATRRGKQLAKLTRWYTPAEVLKMATHDNAELLALSGPRTPYPGKLGVVEEGALADLLLVDGDPLADIKLIEDPEKNFHVIMKDGKIYKNTIK